MPGSLSQREHYNAVHAGAEEPWNYGGRGAERLRHATVAAAVRSFFPGADAKILDVGCSAGRLTALLVPLSRELWAADISDVTIARIRERYRGNPPFHTLVAGVLDIPLPDASLDAVILSDGIAEWKLDRAQRELAFAEVNRLLRPGGIALFTDYLAARDFEGWTAAIGAGPWEVLEQRFLNDRLWYQFESLFKAVRGWKPVRALLASEALAGWLQKPARLLGRRGSKHLMIVVQKRKETAL